MGEEVDFFNFHRAAASKLKKRFLKKPNVAEASSEFEQLKNHLSRIECFPYAGFTAIARAKCEQGLLNQSGEVDSLIEAARFFLKADKEIDEMNCPNFHEHLECSMGCFNMAIKIYEENGMSVAAGSVCLEQAEFYKQTHRYDQAIQHYQRAVEYFSGLPSQAISTMDKVMFCQTLIRDFRSALNSSMDMMKLIKKEGAYHLDRVTPLGCYNDYYKKCEVTRLLLLLLLQPRPLAINKDYAEVFQQYTWPDEESMASGSHILDTLLGEDLFIFLRSVVMACSGGDIDAIKTVQDGVKDYISVEQNVLLQRIVDEYCHPKY
ncbi:40-kDa huntingtin-associated protein-like [Styela clava]